MVMRVCVKKTQNQDSKYLLKNRVLPQVTLHCLEYKQGPQGPQKLSSLISLKIHNSPNDNSHFRSCNYQKLRSYQILGGKTVKNVQINPYQHGDVID